MKEYNNLLEQSLAWVNMGISVIPCKEKSKVPAISWKQYQQQNPDYTDLLKWFHPGKYHHLNMGIVTGWNGLIVLDFDNIEVFQTWIALFSDVKTLVVSTSRGAHVYLFCKETIQAGPVANVGDIKANGGYVLSPGSIHPNSTEYKILHDYPIQTVNTLKEVFPFYEPQQEAKKRDFERFINGNNQIDINDISPWEIAEKPQLTDLLRQIKTNFKIIDLFPEAQQKGKHWFIARCPLHDDHSPSMWIDTSRNLCGCYAGCNNGRPLDVINLFAQINNTTNQDAIDHLRSRL